MQIGSNSFPNPPARDARLRALAEHLESRFLAQMLTTAGLGKTPDAFGGGAGEDQFASFLVQEYADAAVDRGGIGLSEAIYRSLIAHGGSR